MCALYILKRWMVHLNFQEGNNEGKHQNPHDDMLWLTKQDVISEAHTQKIASQVLLGAMPVVIK